MGVLQDNDVEDVGAVPVCKACGSERIVKHAFACWNREAGLWELETTLATLRCLACGKTDAVRWIRPAASANQRIRELNDRFRTCGEGQGQLVVTQGVAELGEEATLRIVTAVRQFNAFNEDNDPWGEHDFGALEAEGQKIFWKIDYYDLLLTAHSANAANEGQTRRVLTIMLASEY
ncbi:MAG: DUF3768 domain-containing protein [Pseudomonadota bacterium]